MFRQKHYEIIRPRGWLTVGYDAERLEFDLIAAWSAETAQTGL